MWWSQRKKTHWLTFQASGSRSSRFIVELGTVVEKRLIRIQRAKAKVDGAGRPGRTPGANARGERLGPRPLKARAADWKRRARTFRNCFFFQLSSFSFSTFLAPFSMPTTLPCSASSILFCIWSDRFSLQNRFPTSWVLPTFTGFYCFILDLAAFYGILPCVT